MAEQHVSQHDSHAEGIELPAPTAAPLILSLGITVLAFGWATHLAFVLVGLVIFIAGLASWIAQLLPGRGHVLEPLVAEDLRPRKVTAALGRVGQLRPGMPGYRLRLPEKVHPISAGLKGGIVGGLVMPIPALIYGLVSGEGIWLPINLLAGIVLPGIEQLSDAELRAFQPVLLTAGVAIHIAVSLMFGTIYGVLLPTLPAIPRALAWAALFAPLAWTAAAFIATSVVDPDIQSLIDWPYFVLSQFVFGVSTATVIMAAGRGRSISAGLLGGVIGGVLMAAPAMLWGYASGHGIWYPVNLLAAMILPQEQTHTIAELEQFNARWFAAACAVHAVVSLMFGAAAGLLLPRLGRIPSPFAWGAMLMPLLWTAASYSMMGIVNPALQQRVDWPWFVVSQFVFGIAAAIVVVRSQQIAIAPAGRGAKP